MSTTTTLELPLGSSAPSWTPGSSLSKRHENSVPRSTSDPTSLTRMPSLLLLPSKKWSKSNFSSQTLDRSHCPRVHYHPWCSKCQTLMEWEPPQPIKQKSTKSILPFWDLKTVVKGRSHFWSHFWTQIEAQNALKRTCSTWRDKQFTRAVAKRSGQLAAQEALHWQVHRQCAACGAALPA